MPRRCYLKLRLAKKVDKFLASNIFRYLLFPIGSTVLGIGVKVVTRNDRYRSFMKEDMAVGLDLMLTAFLLFLALTSDRSLTLVSVDRAMEVSRGDAAGLRVLQSEAEGIAHLLTTSGWVIALMAIGLWSASSVVRKFGWKSETELNPILGIGLPIAIGVLFLIVVMAEAVP